MQEMPGGKMPGGQMKNRLGSESATMSELFPVIGEKKNLLKKGHLLAAGAVLLYAIVLFACLDQPDAFRSLLGLGLGVAVYTALYQMCGKKKSWYVLAGAALLTMIVMISPLWELIYLLFYSLTGNPKGTAPDTLPQLLLLRIVSTGGAEELTKILPVLLFWSLGRKLGKLSVTEPLDGILFAMASALGFVFVETLGQYASNAVKQAGQTAGLELVIVRILWAFKGHLAYSGYFGYFVGLAAMKPKHAVKLVFIGYGCAAVMHGLWDSFANGGIVVQLVLGVVFYALLIAGVLKAREISPTRQQNFATVVTGPLAPEPPLANRAAANAAPPPMPRPYVPPPPPKPQAAPPPPSPAPPPIRPQPAAQPQVAPVTPVQPNPPVQPAAGGAVFKLLVGLRTLTLREGSRIQAGEISGLAAASSDGVIGLVNHNPKDPTMLGLQNLSTTSWKVTLPGGELREVPAGKSVRLASGARIDFGASQGEVQ